MELLVLVALLLLCGVASATGHTADSRDYADWKPTVDGVRAHRW
jgi:hypothetical protein